VTRDLREHPRYLAIREYFARAYSPSLGRASGAVELAVSPDGTQIAFDGPVLEKLEGLPASRIGIVDADGTKLRTLTFGPNSDRLPRWSPDGKRLAFLSDRAEKGRFQLYALAAGEPGEAARVCEVVGTVEWFDWSPDGAHLLLQTAGLDADAAGAAGSGTIAKPGAGGAPAWLPDVEPNVPQHMWREAWIVDAAGGGVRRASPEGTNVWEAAWLGNDAFLGVVSENPREGAWYGAHLAAFALGGGAVTIHRPKEEIGLPAASPDGRWVAVVEACCSDRAVVAGDVWIYDRHAPASAPRRADTGGVDVTHLAWAGNGRFFFAGLRRFETVAGTIDAASAAGTEIWSTRETCGKRYPAAWPVPGRDAFALVLHSYERYPAIAIVEGGKARIVADFADAGSAYVAACGGTLAETTWRGRDGLEIDGFFIAPDGPGPHPLVVNVHGGPVWAFRNSWSMWYYFTSIFVKHGYAVLCPNPRGSGGRGQAFARMVRGDMCGEDTHDIIAGVRHLVERGLVDERRVAVTGGSYGGFMSSWLVTQTDEFAAAIPVSPVTDNFSFQFTSNIPRFNEIFLADSPYHSSGRYAQRSPVFFARNVKTPTLHMTGALDRCTPPTQAMEFHRALVEHGVPSELVVYPLEGHGVRALEAQADQMTRILDWLDRYMPSPGAPS
jgi:dipeptidyl aminopeptidase/acylaminoacyl peptidase